MINKFEKKLSNLIKKEGLNDLSMYFRGYETYEEIPLFSRYKHISFINSLSFNEKNKILINKGICIINNIIKASCEYLNEKEKKNYFIGLSITDWAFDDYNEINCLTPCIYVSKRKGWILSCLELTQKNSIEENLIKEYLCALNINDYDVYVASKSSEFKRVYILNKYVISSMNATS